MAKGGGSANKSYLFQETKALLNKATLLPWIFEKIQTLGTAACPPYHLAIAIGGTSAEHAGSFNPIGAPRTARGGGSDPSGSERERSVKQRAGAIRQAVSASDPSGRERERSVKQ